MFHSGALVKLHFSESNDISFVPHEQNMAIMSTNIANGKMNSSHHTSNTIKLKGMAYVGKFRTLRFVLVTVSAAHLNNDYIHIIYYVFCLK